MSTNLSRATLDPILLNNVVRITTAGDLLGSGSIVSVRSESGRERPYLVTAHHVVRSQILIEIDVPDPAGDGLQEGISVEAEHWRQPIADVDLAIAPFPYQHVARWQAFSLEEQFIDNDVVVPLGGTVHYLGIFASTGTPMARTGTIGAYDVPIDKTENDRRYRYDADLLDCRSYSGFSGSPCLGVLTFAVLDRVAEIPAGVPPEPDGSPPSLGRTANLARFCGILTSHYSDECTEGAGGVVSRYGVGVMLPSHYIHAALTDQAARDERRERDHAGEKS
jgi:hypothetical protein